MGSSAWTKGINAAGETEADGYSGGSEAVMTVNSPWDEPDSKSLLRKVFLEDLQWILTAFEVSYGCLGSEQVLTLKELEMLSTIDLKLIDCYSCRKNEQFNNRIE